MGIISLDKYELTVAKDYLIRSLDDPIKSVDPLRIYPRLEFISYLAIAQREITRAARLLGSTESCSEWLQALRAPKERTEREKAIATVREGLGEAAFAKAWKDGQAMTLEQAIAYAKEGK